MRGCSSADNNRRETESVAACKPRETRLLHPRRCPPATSEHGFEQHVDGQQQSCSKPNRKRNPEEHHVSLLTLR